MPDKKYVIITPCRDEAQYARLTLESVVNQSVKPTLWLIIDDGSKDQTPKILAEYAAKYDFIRVIRREDRGQRSVGPGVIEAFYHGLDTINLDDFDYLCKLDLDLDLPLDYFKILMDRMEQNPRLGACSGKPYFPGPNGELIPELCGDEHSVGMTKFYRRQCFQEIGGFVRQVMWDGIDGHRCRMLGWIACSWDEPELRFKHLRPMGSSQQSIITGRMRHGFGQYFMGTSLLYITISSLLRMTHRPFIIGGACIWWGYIKALLQRKPRYDDLNFRKFLRAYQWNCILNGKNKATQSLNHQQESVFKARHP